MVSQLTHKILRKSQFLQIFFEKNKRKTNKKKYLKNITNCPVFSFRVWIRDFGCYDERNNIVEGWMRDVPAINWTEEVVRNEKMILDSWYTTIFYQIKSVLGRKKAARGTHHFGEGSRKRLIFHDIKEKLKRFASKNLEGKEYAGHRWNGNKEQEYVGILVTVDVLLPRGKMAGRLCI